MCAPYGYYCTPIINACQEVFSWYSIAMRDKTPKLAMLLKRLLGAVKNVEQAIQEQTNAKNSKNEQEGKKQNPPPEVRAEIRFPEDVERANSVHKEKEYSLAKWNVIGTWATFGMVTIYAGIAAYQACLMRESTIASQQAAEAIRPRLVVGGLTPAPLTSNGLPMDQGKLHVSFQVPNYGPVIAANLRVREFDNVSTRDKVSKLPYGQPHFEFGPIVPPAPLVGNQIAGWGIDGDKILIEDELIGLKEKRLVATFSILVEYDDAAGRTHHTESCIIFTFPPNWGSETCPWKPQND